MTDEELLREFTSWCVARDLSAPTIRLRRYQLAAAGREFTLATATSTDVIDYLARQEWGTETRRSHLAALRVFYRWAVRFGHRDDDPTVDLAPVRMTCPAPRPVPEPVLAEAFRVADDTTRLALALGAFAGLRLGEMCRVHTDDLDADALLLHVHGKGRRGRVVPVAEDLAAMIAARGPGYVFPGRGGGHCQVTFLAKRVSPLLGRWSAHALRHRFAQRAYDGSGDVLAVSTLLGHSKPETTLSYVQTGMDTLRAVAAAAQ